MGAHVQMLAHDDGTPDDAMPTMTMLVTLTKRGGGTLMAIETHFASLEALEQVAAMGMEEGMVEALGQIPGILAENATTPS